MPLWLSSVHTKPLLAKFKSLFLCYFLHFIVLYVQIPYGFSAYVQNPCLLNLKTYFCLIFSIFLKFAIFVCTSFFLSCVYNPLIAFQCVYNVLACSSYKPFLALFSSCFLRALFYILVI